MGSGEVFTFRILRIYLYETVWSLSTTMTGMRHDLATQRGERGIQNLRRSFIEETEGSQLSPPVQRSASKPPDKARHELGGRPPPPSSERARRRGHNSCPHARGLDWNVHGTCISYYSAGT